MNRAMKRESCKNKKDDVIELKATIGNKREKEDCVMMSTRIGVR